MPYYAHIDRNGRVLSAGFSNADVSAIPPFQGVPAVATAGLLQVTDQRAPPTYADQRRQSYPSIGDQLDALWRGGEAPEEMRAKILEVKERYPKPGLKQE